MSDRALDVAVYGIINAGKSSLINALAGRNERPAGPIGGTTVDVAGVEWRVVETVGDAGPSDPSPQPSPARGEGAREEGESGDALRSGGASSSDPSPQPSPTRGEGARRKAPAIWAEGVGGEKSTRTENTEDELSAPLSPCGGGLGRGVAGDSAHATDAIHYTIRLLDTPGLEEVGDEVRGHLATAAARSADLVLFVLSEDLTATARRALVHLKEVGKPIVVALNKVDLLDPEEQATVLAAVRKGLEDLIPAEDIVPIAAAPIVRRLVILPGGGSRVETTRGEPEVDALERRLLDVLASSAGDLKALADAASRVESHVATREGDRARLRERAERVADETSAALAVALAVNPVPLLDFLAGPGGLAILVRRVSEVYGEHLSREVARGLAGELIRGGRVVLWGSLAATIGGGAMKILPGFGHLAGALTQGASAGYFGHVVGRALVDYLDHGHDWGDGGLVAALDRIAASTDRKAITRGLVDRIKARLKGRG